jgi:hypothetical protein
MPLYLKIFSASFLNMFLSLEFGISIHRHVPFLLPRIKDCSASFHSLIQ